MSYSDLRQNLDTRNDGWDEHAAEIESEYRTYLASLVRRGRLDARRGSALAFSPAEQPYNRSAEYAAWRRGYDHTQRAMGA